MKLAYPIFALFLIYTYFGSLQWEGNWYDISSYPSDSDRASCALWSHNLEGNTLQVQESEVLRQELYLRNGSAIALGGWNGKLNVQYTDGDGNIFECLS